MPLTGKEALELHEALVRQAEQARQQRLANAKADAAANGKEPFDYDKLTRMAQTIFDATLHMNDADRAVYFEEMYYTSYPQVMSLAEFVEHVNELGRWM